MIKTSYIGDGYYHWTVRFDNRSAYGYARSRSTARRRALAALETFLAETAS